MLNQFSAWLSPPLAKCDQVGLEAKVLGLPHVVNRGQISIGARFSISAIPARSHLVTEETGSIELGDDVTVGPGSGIASSLSIRVGSGTRIGSFVLIMDSDYHVAGDTDAVAPTSPVEIGSNVSIGHNSIVLRGTTIPDNSNIPHGSIVQGVVSARLRDDYLSATHQEILEAIEGTLYAGSRPFDEVDGVRLSDPLISTSLRLTLEEAYGLPEGSLPLQWPETPSDLARLIEHLSIWT